MVNVCLETNGSRPRLLEQTLRTLYKNTPADQYNLTMICDGTPEFIYRAENTAPPVIGSMLLIEPPCYVTGRLKNLGAYWSEKQFGRGEWLCFIDDDIAVQPGWLEKMISVISGAPQVRILGGNRHPYHGANGIIGFVGTLHQFLKGPYIEITDAVAGYSMLMRWETFDKYGPFDAHAKGIAQSEDYAFARRIVDDGGKVGYIHPPVLYHTGVTNSSGQPATGAEKIERVPGILYL